MFVYLEVILTIRDKNIEVVSDFYHYMSIKQNMYKKYDLRTFPILLIIELLKTLAAVYIGESIEGPLFGKQL